MPYPPMSRICCTTISFGKNSRAAESSSVFHEGIVREAIQPSLTGLRGSDHGMGRGTSMLAGVTIRGRIAAECGAARLACAQMNPRCMDFDALFARMGLRMFRCLDRLDVPAGRVVHRCLTPVQVRCDSIARERPPGRRCSRETPSAPREAMLPGGRLHREG
jgi:hypothetical protein